MPGWGREGEVFNQSLPECDLDAELHFDIVNFVNASYHQVHLGDDSDTKWTIRLLANTNRARKGKLTLMKVGPSDELRADGLILGSYVFSPAGLDRLSKRENRVTRIYICPNQVDIFAPRGLIEGLYEN